MSVLVCCMVALSHFVFLYFYKKVNNCVYRIESFYFTCNVAVRRLGGFVQNNRSNDYQQIFKFYVIFFAASNYLTGILFVKIIHVSIDFDQNKMYRPGYEYSIGCVNMSELLERFCEENGTANMLITYDQSN